MTLPESEPAIEYDPAAVPTADKYSALAEGWSEGQYADASAYLEHRTALTLAMGPPLIPGDRVLELGCADASYAPYLQRAGLVYTGMDGSPGMVEAANRNLGPSGTAVLGDLNTFVSPAPAAATLCFRAIYYVHDREAFFRRAAGYTTKKLVFDFSPRRCSVAAVRRELAAAGFDRVRARPFFAPQRRRLPRLLQSTLYLLERSGPLARLLLRVHFAYLVVAWKQEQPHASA